MIRGDKRGVASGPRGVSPFAVGAHPGFAGSSSILRFRDGRDSLSSQLALERSTSKTPNHSRRPLRRMKRVALGHRGSVAMIVALTKEMARSEVTA